MDIKEIEDALYLQNAQRVINEMGWYSFAVGKVITQHRDRYMVRSLENEFGAQVVGHYLFEATDKNELPVVGDWVVFQPFEDQGIIHGVLPRKTTLYNENKLIASNLDAGLIVMGADRDFNPNRAERYLSICFANDIDPMIVITKVDDLDDETRVQLAGEMDHRFKKVPHYLIDSITGRGLQDIHNHLRKDHTYALMGSSGAGKSTLINALLGEERMSTSGISKHVNKGKHTTTHRELIELSNGAFVIDNPGLRAVGIGGSGEGIEQTFSSIEELATKCKFGDCSHTNEPGCEVLAAVETGKISREAYDNYLKLLRENEHYESTEFERRKKGKSLSKMVKRMKKDH